MWRSPIPASTRTPSTPRIWWSRPAGIGQDEIFPVHRYHAIFTDSPFPLVQARLRRPMVPVTCREAACTIQTARPTVPACDLSTSGLVSWFISAGLVLGVPVRAFRDFVPLLDRHRLAARGAMEDAGLLRLFPSMGRHRLISSAHRRQLVTTDMLTGTARVHADAEVLVHVDVARAAVHRGRLRPSEVDLRRGDFQYRRHGHGSIHVPARRCTSCRLQNQPIPPPRCAVHRRCRRRAVRFCHEVSTATREKHRFVLPPVCTNSCLRRSADARPRPALATAPPYGTGHSVQDLTGVLLRQRTTRLLRPPQNEHAVIILLPTAATSEMWCGFLPGLGVGPREVATAGTSVRHP